MPDDDLDPELLMLYLQRSIDPGKLPGKQTVIRFQFTDLTDHPLWWIVVKGQEVLSGRRVVRPSEYVLLIKF